jgi:phosphatidylglycerol:prolipoprotein diacylglycerol transferase
VLSLFAPVLFAPLLGLLSVISYNPVVKVHLGPLSLSPHGVGIAVGFLLGARFLLPDTRARGIPDEEMYPLFTRAAIGAIIGARLAYVINHAGDYSSILDVLRVWKGGISLLGGITGAVLMAVPRMRSRKLSFWKIMDAAAPGVALGITVGRIGDLIIGDHLGKVTTFFLGYRCPPVGVEVGSPCVPGTIVHQTALYDQMLAFVLLMVLLRLRKRSHYEGFLAMVFVAWYACNRILEDFLREDLRHFGLTGSQWWALTMLTLSLYGLIVLRRTPRWGRWDERPSPDPVTEPAVTEPAVTQAETRPETAPVAPTLSEDEPETVLEEDIGGEDRPEEGERSGDPDRGHPVPEGDRD